MPSSEPIKAAMSQCMTRVVKPGIGSASQRTKRIDNNDASRDRIMSCSNTSLSLVYLIAVLFVFLTIAVFF